jgi:hypothetical protein
VYVCEDYKCQLLLMHVLVVALDVEGWSLAPAQSDALQKELKMTAADVVARWVGFHWLYWGSSSNAAEV